MFDSNEDSYLLYKVFQGKYNHCKESNEYGYININEQCFRTQFTEYKFAPSPNVAPFDRPSLYISTTDKAEKVLQRIYEQIYQSQIDTNRLDPSEF